MATLLYKKKAEILSKSKIAERQPINFDKATYDGKRFFAKGQNKSIAKSERELTEMILRLVAVFDTNPFTVHYSIEMYPERKLTVTATGKSTFSIGSMSEAEKQELRRKLFDEVKVDIQAEKQELTVNEVR